MTEKGSEDVGHLAEEALRRKERLRQLRKRAHNGRADGVPLGSKEDEDDGLPKPIFRNYQPTSDNLKEGQLPKPKVIDLTEHVKEQIAAGKSKTVLDEVNLESLAPRKPDWDLKRAVDKKLKKLEKRTQRSIAELIRDRLKNEDDLASAVTQLQ